MVKLKNTFILKLYTFDSTKPICKFVLNNDVCNYVMGGNARSICGKNITMNIENCWKKLFEKHSQIKNNIITTSNQDSLEEKHKFRALATKTRCIGSLISLFTTSRRPFSLCKV